MKRMMCVYLPNWPLQRLQRERPELRDKSLSEKGTGPLKSRVQSPFRIGFKALVLVNNGAARGPKVVFCSASAARSGIHPGMPVAEAVAIDPRLGIEEYDPVRDVQALQQLAKWAERWSPLVGLEEGPAPQSLLLNLTGCTDCFQGEEQLLRRALRELAEAGWAVRLAIADTIGAAWGLAHYGRSPLLAPAGQGEKFLGPLPAAALRLPTDTLDLLAKLGLERIDQLIALPRASLASRFGPLLLQRLDEALGRLPETLAPHRLAPPVQAGCSFEYPTDQRQALHYALDRLTQRIQEALQGRHCGARQVECWLYHESAAPLRVEINLFRPSDSLPYLRMLLREQLEQVAIAEPVCGMRLHVSQAEPLADSQTELFEGQSSAALQELAALIDRLSSRLGQEAVTRPALVPDAQPECACRFEPLLRTDSRRAGSVNLLGPGAKRRKTSARILERVQGVDALRAPSLLRPLRLWPRPLSIEVMSIVPEGPPVRFRWQGVDYRIIRTWGPERIETGWWRCHDVQRDYYVVVTQVGNRFWLFRRRDDGRWFLHGCFD